LNYLMGAMAISPDGKTVAYDTPNHTVGLLDYARRRPFGYSLQGHASTIRDLTFSHRGKLLASAGRDQTVWLWEMDPDSWADRLCSVANRNLSLAEWQQYIGSNVPYRRTCPEFLPGEGVPSK
jgi:WD40 repeat protein